MQRWMYVVLIPLFNHRPMPLEVLCLPILHSNCTQHLQNISTGASVGMRAYYNVVADQELGGKVAARRFLADKIVDNNKNFKFYTLYPLIWMN